MFVVTVAAVLSSIVLVLIHKKLPTSVREAKTSITITVPVLALLYSSIVNDTLTTAFPTYRYYIFCITFLFCLLLLVVFYPYFLLHVFGFGKFSVLANVLHLLFILAVGSLVPSNEFFFSFFGMIDKLAILGIFISAVFSGYSAVSIPVKQLDPFHKKYSRAEYEETQQQLKFMERRGETQSELYRMVYTTYLQMSDSFESEKRKKGVVGVYHKSYGLVMTLFCIWKLLNSFIHLVGLTSNRGTSWVTKSLNILSRVVHLPIDWNIIAYYISFVMVGILVITGVKGILSKTLKMITSFDETNNSKIKGGVIVCACYFITIYSFSFVIMLRSNFVASTSIVYYAFEDVDYDMYTSVSDFVFCITALLSLAFYYLKNKYGFFKSNTESKLPL
ncbi:hypothetical protein EIN_097560 [Entamoeba invadens IP1]|uniref:Abscisic acid G-protein coupled receptor-like domain-containing protein n=1 Tax=Entamoeba invadens IP1 TaxID=370355 RepID=A0A0A1U0P3_ENTIV|nr:hypothetical protein EIN_097560 [Entamoeba invadens IP1]ELP87469.1 hypothetical protein EIN_097560 [Entamoeba invadens IP1]|eukprot:XP_004254240.1 hypothetical protein EIN_097560 [Entamoeba invadens IP1]